MKFRFTTSVASALHSFVEGTVIEPTEIDPHVRQWLTDGVLVPVRDEEAMAIPPEPERAVRLHGRRGRSKTLAQ